MLSRLLFCRGTVVNNSSVKALLPSYVSQKCLSLKFNSTLASHFSCDTSLLSLSKLRVSNLSVFKQNGAALLTKGNSNNFVPFRQKAQIALDINTNIANNVFLYKYDRPKYFRNINIFSAFQLLFWLGVCCFMWTQLPPLDSEKSLKQYLIDNFPMAGVCLAAVLVGSGAFLLIWIFTSKSVRYIILHKGGKNVTFITYHPLNKDIKTTVPIDNLKCKTGRNQMKNFLPIKVQGRSFYYILDSSGEFVNPLLFDHTVGVMRS